MNEKHLIEALIRQRDAAMNRVAQLEAALNAQAEEKAKEQAAKVIKEPEAE